MGLKPKVQFGVPGAADPAVLRGQSGDGWVGARFALGILAITSLTSKNQLRLIFNILTGKNGVGSSTVKDRRVSTLKFKGK